MKKIFKAINHYWRIIATAECFLLFGLGSLLLSYIVSPIINLITRDERKRGQRNQRVINIVFKFFIFMISLLGIADIEFKDFDKVKNDKGLLIISNHPSLLDYVIIVSQLKHCKTVVKEALFNNFFVKTVLKSANYISNKESSDILEQIREDLNLGNNLLLFPEGTRSEPGCSLKLQRGAAQIALRINVPVRLIKISTSYPHLTKSMKWYEVAPGKVKYRVEAGNIVTPAKFLTQAEDSFAIAARHLTNYFTDELQKR